MDVRSRLRAAAIAGVLSMPGCATPPGPPLDVEYAGCEGVKLPGPVCTLKPDRALQLWLRPPAGAEVEISAGGRRRVAAGVEVGGGRRFSIEVPDGAGKVAVRVTGEGGMSSWSLAVADRPSWLGQAEELREAGHLDAARVLLLEKVDRGSLDERAVALKTLAQHQYRDRHPSLEPGPALLRQAIEAHRQAGSFQDLVDDTSVLLHPLIETRDFSAAGRLLASLEPGAMAPAAGMSAEVDYLLAYYRGLLAARVGDARSALAELRSALDQAERTGQIRDWRLAGQVLGWQLQALGRTRESAELFARLSEASENEAPRDRARLLTNQAWSLILAHEAGESAVDPSPMLEEVLSIYAGMDLVPDSKRFNAVVNLALAHLQRRRSDQARSAIERARSLWDDATPLERLWWLEVRARVALGDGDANLARDLHGQMEDLAANVFAPDSRWRAVFGRARAQVALGMRPEALASLAEAEDLLEEQSLMVPIHEGRETFIASYEDGTRLYLDLLLANGRLKEAFAVARRSRSRVLRGLRLGDRVAALDSVTREAWYQGIGRYRTLREDLAAQGAIDWQLPARERDRRRAARSAHEAELRRLLDQALAVLGPAGTPPSLEVGAGTLVLTYHPLPAGWVAFAADDAGVTARRFELSDRDLEQSDELSARILEPFRRQIERARRLHVLPYGALREVDFHALPFGSGPLLATLPVVYSLDLGVPPAPAPSGRPRALVVADPRLDLPAARREAQAVEKALEALPEAWDVRLLWGVDARTDAVSGGLEAVDLFHYAGHGVFKGSGGWQSALLLADGGRLTPGDLLALSASPRQVILSGCETARSAAVAPLEAIGLAQAFLVAGSRQVVAAVRPVNDRTAGELIAHLYGGWSSSRDLAALLREAQLEGLRRKPGVDWASFRVLEP